MQCTPDGHILACLGLSQDGCETAAADPADVRPEAYGGCLGGEDYSQHREGCYPDEEDGEITRYLKWVCADATPSPPMPPATPPPTTGPPGSSQTTRPPTTRPPTAPPTTRPPVSQPPTTPVPDLQDPTSRPTDEGGSSAAGSGDDASAMSSTVLVAIIGGAVLSISVVLLAMYVVRGQQSAGRGGGRGAVMNPTYELAAAKQCARLRNVRDADHGVLQKERDCPRQLLPAAGGLPRAERGLMPMNACDSTRCGGRRRHERLNGYAVGSPRASWTLELYNTSNCERSWFEAPIWCASLQMSTETCDSVGVLTY